MFEQQDPTLTLAIVGGITCVAAVRYAYKRGLEKGGSAPSGLVTGTRACDLEFLVGTSPTAGEFKADLKDMPHLLIAGMTGSGKSTFLSSMLVDLIDQYPPDELKLVLIDPKRVELAPFRSAPHVLSYTWETSDAISRLYWAHREMTGRYKALEKIGVRKIEEAEGLPRIVIVVEELANLMLSSSRKVVQNLIVVLASMGRAVGIHLVLVTQRPSVDVVTGILKANIPARVALAVVTQVDSRVILDQGGAEKLAGRGDLLVLRPDLRNLVRLQGRQVTNKQIADAVDKWKGA